jgi:predicted regulator of Ras-like GTPase activity (Roadblock/LC7/MglB family)
MGLMPATQEFSWLLGRFVTQAAGVRGAVAVSSDGLLMAMSPGLDRAAAEPVAAIVSGLTSLGLSAASALEGEGLERIVVAMGLGVLLISSVSDGSAIGVVARGSCDIAAVGYQMTVLVQRAGALLTPALVVELRQQLLES